MAHSLKVSSKSVPHSVAGALAGILRERATCEIQVIGAGALNQAIKAAAIARTYLVEDELDLVCVPEFTEVDIDGQARTAIRLVVERRPARPGAVPPAIPATLGASETIANDIDLTRVAERGLFDKPVTPRSFPNSR